jgi:hypothetical protein
MSAYGEGYVRGLRACIGMLETMAVDTCVIVNHARRRTGSHIPEPFPDTSPAARP